VTRPDLRITRGHLLIMESKTDVCNQMETCYSAKKSRMVRVVAHGACALGLCAINLTIIPM